MLIKTAEQNFCDIGAAIRETLGTTRAYKKSEMAPALDEGLNNPSWGVSYTFDIDNNPLTAKIYGCTISGLGGTPSTLTIEYDDVSKITAIGPFAFYGSELTNYEVPEGVTSIGKNSFCNSHIASISLPDGLEIIDEYAFHGCENLVISSLPDSVTNIGRWAFYSDDSITDVILPSNLITIGTEAFGWNTGLKTITFKSKPTNMASKVFCSYLETLNVPWSEGEVEGAPWGATNATINYNYSVT